MQQYGTYRSKHKHKAGQKQEDPHSDYNEVLYSQ